MKTVMMFFLLLITTQAQAADLGACNGTVLQRRFALVQLGRLVDAYRMSNSALPDLCAAPVVGVSDRIPDLLKGASVCGSGKEGFVYYACQLPAAPASTHEEESPVIETCRYSLVDQSVSCENRSVMTTFEES